MSFNSSSVSENPDLNVDWEKQINSFFADEPEIRQQYVNNINNTVETYIPDAIAISAAKKGFIRQDIVALSMIIDVLRKNYHDSTLVYYANFFCKIQVLMVEQSVDLFDSLKDNSSMQKYLAKSKARFPTEQEVRKILMETRDIPGLASDLMSSSLTFSDLLDQEDIMEIFETEGLHLKNMLQTVHSEYLKKLKDPNFKAM